MLLYPHLPPTVARKLAEDLIVMDIDSLRVLSAISHPAAAYAPTGGNRVNDSYLREIDRYIRESADNCGYPDSVDDSRLRGFDASSGRILHEMMEISPSGASNPGVWAFMACVLWPDLVRWRFPGDTDGTSRKERFIGGRRNTFGRVWWRAYILRQPESIHPYELLDLLGEDELVQITERPSLAGSPTLAREVCRTFLEVSGGPAPLRSRLLLRDAMKRLRRLLPMVSFDALDAQVLKSLIEEVFRSSIQSLSS